MTVQVVSTLGQTFSTTFTSISATNSFVPVFTFTPPDGANSTSSYASIRNDSEAGVGVGALPSSSVAVSNVAPSVAIGAISAIRNEGTPVTVSATITDEIGRASGRVRA